MLVFLGMQILPMPTRLGAGGLSLQASRPPVLAGRQQKPSLGSPTASWLAAHSVKAAEDTGSWGAWAISPLGRQAASDLARHQASQDSSPALWEDWEPGSWATLEPDNRHLSRQLSGETRQSTCLNHQRQPLQHWHSSRQYLVFIKSILPSPMELNHGIVAQHEKGFIKSAWRCFSRSRKFENAVLLLPLSSSVVMLE